MTFEFFTEDGTYKLDYEDYLKRPDLMEKIQDKRRVFVNLGLRIFSFDRRWLNEHPKYQGFVEQVRMDQEANPIRYFLPHCAKHKDFNTESHRFINDADHIYSAILAGNRYGKSTIMMAKIITTFGLIPTEPDWEIYKDHGVKYREWTGPKEIALSSYNWSNIGETVWPQVARAWLPKDELGQFAQYGAPKNTAFSIELKCGSIIHFKCMAQPQSAFESQALDGFGWDEQGVETKVDGAEARLRTRRHFSQDENKHDYLTSGWHVCATTPHKVEGRPDTGAGTWFHKLYNRTITKGWTVSFAKGNLIDDVPDWVFPEVEKARLLKSLEESREMGDRKAVRALESRIYGDFETTGGMVYDEFDEAMHVIDGIDIKPEWSAFRCMDHGRTNPTSCIFVAVTPENDYIAFKEYLAQDKTISENVENIVRLSGNSLEQAGEIKVGLGMLPRFTENVDGPEGSQYMFDVLDGRTFRNPDSNSRYTIGDIYRYSGLSRIRPAPIQSIDATIPIIKELLKIRKDRKHIVTGKKGAPRLYFLRSGVPRLIEHLQGYRNKEDNRSGIPSEKPHAKDDHDLDALRYGFMMNPKHMPHMPYKPDAIRNNMRTSEFWELDENKNKRSGSEVRDRYTGY